MNSPCFANTPYIFHPPSESSATETDDSTDSGCEKTVDGGIKTKYIDPKRRTINKVSKKILKAIERLTCNIKRPSKTKKLSESYKKNKFKGQYRLKYCRFFFNLYQKLALMDWRVEFCLKIRKTH